MWSHTCETVLTGDGADGGVEQDLVQVGGWRARPGPVMTTKPRSSARAPFAAAVGLSHAVPLEAAAHALDDGRVEVAGQAGLFDQRVREARDGVRQQHLTGLFAQADGAAGRAEGAGSGSRWGLLVRLWQCGGGGQRDGGTQEGARGFAVAYPAIRAPLPGRHRSATCRWGCWRHGGRRGRRRRQGRGRGARGRRG